MLPKRLAELVRTEIDKLDPHDPNNRRAKEYGLLPIHVGMGGWTGISPDGKFYEADDFDTVSELSERRLIVYALRMGAKRYPALAELLPRRPDGVPDCPFCEGHGRVRLTDDLSVDCGRCGGIGWSE